MRSSTRDIGWWRLKTITVVENRSSEKRQNDPHGFLYMRLYGDYQWKQVLIFPSLRSIIAIKNQTCLMFSMEKNQHDLDSFRLKLGFFSPQD